jgi:hypothetical protein
LKLDIVVEGATDARIVRAFLGPQLSSVIRFHTSQGKASLARCCSTVNHRDYLPFGRFPPFLPEIRISARRRKGQI